MINDFKLPIKQQRLRLGYKIESDNIFHMRKIQKAGKHIRLKI